MANHKLDIFKTLRAIDNHDMDYYDRLTDEEKKGFIPTVVVRWMSHARMEMAEYYLEATNSRFNTYLYEMADYPDLQYKLAASCGLNMKADHQWLAMKKANTGKNILPEFMRRVYPNYNDLEISILLSQYTTKKEFEDFVNGTGTDTAEAKKIIKSFEQLYL